MELKALKQIYLKESYAIASNPKGWTKKALREKNETLKMLKVEIYNANITQGVVR